PPPDPHLADGSGDPRGDPPADRSAGRGRCRRARRSDRPPLPRPAAAGDRGAGGDGPDRLHRPVPAVPDAHAGLHPRTRCPAGHRRRGGDRVRGLAADAPARRGPARPRPPRPPRMAAAIPGRIRSSTRPWCPGCPALARQTPESAMTVYADTPRWPRHGMLWGHLISDTSLEEL